MRLGGDAHRHVYPSPALSDSFSRPLQRRLEPAGDAAPEGPRPGVVHLVWGPLGAEALRRFLCSYRKHPAGAEHELVILLNNVAERQRPELLAELEGVPHRVLDLPEPVQDLAAYAQAARELEHERLCFLNSHSEILAPNWLLKLGSALDEPRAGLVGATGSWGSQRSHLLHDRHLPSAYRSVFPDRRWMQAQFLAIDRERFGEPARLARTRRWLNTWRATVEAVLGFDSFPAPHLRTTAFMVDRLLFVSLSPRARRLRRKVHAFALESGRHSYTLQVRELGLRTCLVDREGASYEPELWPDSRAFWQAKQEGLLIADNQTRRYESGDRDRKLLLARFAWGARASVP
jgi:hypothetical protein